MSTSILGLQISQQAVARGIAAALGVLGATMGLLAIVDPEASATTFGLPASSPMASSRNLFISTMGGSRFAAGLGTLLCLYYGENRAVGLSLIPGIIVCVVDATSLHNEVARLKQDGTLKSEEEVKQAEGKAWGHAFFGPVTLGLGIWMAYLF